MKLLDWIDSFCRWFDWRFIRAGENIPSDLRDCWNSIKRIIAYIPILWRDWDFNCEPGLFALMKKKLERLEPEIVHSIDADKDRTRIRTCITLLDRVIHDSYEKEFEKKHDAKWGEAKVLWVDFEKNEKKFFEILVKRAKIKTPEDQEQATKESMAGRKHANQQRQNAVDFVMKTIAKHHRQWWD